jgi:sulfite reductase (NADPH) flavoprotein alpha-component
MGRGVHSALLEIVEKEGKLSKEKAADYVNQMTQNRKYQADVFE